MLFLIIGVTFLISLIAFVGGLTLFLREKVLEKIIGSLIAFSAGTLMGGAFLHLLPEAISEKGTDESSLLIIFLYVLLGFGMFFVLENFIRWHHHHNKEHPEIMPFSYLILISDGIHNFIDGIIIAASFIIGFPVGIVTALVVASHEIPQEMGEFGVLVYGGFKKTKALLLNFASSITIVFGGIFGFLLADRIGEKIIFLLPLAAGHFIYIAASDLIPEIKHKESIKKSAISFSMFLAGIGVMLLMKLFIDV
ncbi:ZIP family metal transporter [Patescibacteria group bacterium]|nr:ZIP family metal transporter [Patescibacteria group bacterium]